MTTIIRPATDFPTNGTPLGAYTGVPAQDYFDAPGLNHSTLKQLDPPNTPAHVRAYIDGPSEEPAPHLILGTLCHQAILEPEATPPNLAIKPDGMKFSTTDGKAWRAAARNAGKIIVTEEAWTTLKCLTRSVREHPVCQQVFGAGISEVSLFTPTNYGGVTVLRKGRFDWVPPGNALVDVKTTEDGSPSGFADAVAKFSYHSQAAWYLDLWNDTFSDDQRECFVFVVLEKQPPYLVALYSLSAEAIGKGRRRNFERLRVWTDCVREGKWPGYSQEIVPLELPSWYARKESV